MQIKVNSKSTYEWYPSMKKVGTLEDKTGLQRLKSKWVHKCYLRRIMLCFPFYNKGQDVPFLQRLNFA